MIAVVKSPEANNTWMGQVTATEVCRTAAEGWPCWRQNCSQRRGCMHMCSDNPSAASQNAGPMQQHHRCICSPFSLYANCSESMLELVTDFRYLSTNRSNTFITTDVRATGRKSFSAVAFGFFGTGIMLAALKQTGTMCSLREALNKSVNTVAILYNADIFVLSIHL